MWGVDYLNSGLSSIDTTKLLAALHSWWYDSRLGVAYLETVQTHDESDAGRFRSKWSVDVFEIVDFRINCHTSVQTTLLRAYGSRWTLVPATWQPICGSWAIPCNERKVNLTWPWRFIASPCYSSHRCGSARQFILRDPPNHFSAHILVWGCLAILFCTQSPR